VVQRFHPSMPVAQLPSYHVACSAQDNRHGKLAQTVVQAVKQPGRDFLHERILTTLLPGSPLPVPVFQLSIEGTLLATPAVGQLPARCLKPP